MRLPREPFSWDEGEGEEPIFLDDPSAKMNPEALGEAAVVAAAESHVREAQEALARQDTDPYSVEGSAPNGAPAVRSLRLRRQTLARSLRACLIAVLCAMAFAHGWSRGSAQAAASCEPSHCTSDSAPEGSTKEQGR